MGDRLGIRDVVDIFVLVLFEKATCYLALSDCICLHHLNVYGHIMLKAPVLVRSLKLSNIESR
jgi:hypothetical protein